MSAPRHLHFVQSLEPLQGGGLGAAAHQLHAALLKLGQESRLLATCGVRPGPPLPGVLELPRRGPAKLFYAAGMAAAADEWITGDTAVVHGHGFYVWPNATIGRLARRRKIPLVYHPHGMLEPWILRRSRIKKRVAHWLFEDANFRSARLWRALTSREADQVRARGIRSPIVVIPNGVDLGPVKPAQFLRQTGRRRALFLGRLHPKKGLALLIRAWSKADAAADWELVIAGPDECGHEVEVRQWVAAAGLDAAVVFAGPVSGPAKFELLASADLFVLTSYSEGLPMAALEAMAAGVPVAMTHECNLPEVAHNDAGWLCPAEPESVDTMVKEALSADDTERRQRGAAGRKLVERLFTWPRIGAALHEACRQVL